MTFYVYDDGDVLIGEVQDGGKETDATAAYTWGASGLVSERILSSSRSLWYHFGPQGETRQLTDANGNVADTYVYTAYGVPGPTTGSDPNPFRFGGQVGYYTDAAHDWGQPKLVLCGARWYSPDLGRWLSRDPIGYEGGDNLYGYCGSKPVGNVDPSGLDTFIFNGSTLKRYCSEGPNKGQLVGTWPAYSGKPGSGFGGVGSNEILDYHKYGYGPLPPGTYHFTEGDVRPTQSWMALFDPYHRASLFRRPGPWGLFFVRLIPDGETLARIRSLGRKPDFNLHGGDDIGSAGCIDIGHSDKEVLGPMERGVYPPGTVWVSAGTGAYAVPSALPVYSKVVHKVIVSYPPVQGRVPGTIEHPIPWPQRP